MESKFLHNHPRKEKELGLDENHVIVDREEWELAREIILEQQIEIKKKRIGLIGGGFQGVICGIDEAIAIADYHVIKHPDLTFDHMLSQQRYVAEVLSRPEVIEQFKNLSMQVKISNEEIQSLAESLAAYDRKKKLENPKQKHKGHERPYKFHR